jgi:Ser/Thr protein kinase RdoA (MazF antagonist)
LIRTWRITDLSVTCAALLHHAGGDPFCILAGGAGLSRGQSAAT